MSRFSTLTDGRVRMRDYDQAPGFSSFLPGLAGPLGTPIWAFTCNRGQGISSFGINHKGDSILPFQPANLAYEDTPTLGFRTFLLVDGQFLEPFSPLSTGAQRSMTQGAGSLELIEENAAFGLAVHVHYTTLPGEPIGALLRGVTINNTGEKAVHIQLLDGLPRVLPYGLQLGQYKDMGNLFKSWAQVQEAENGARQYNLRSSTGDSERVSEVAGSFFYAAKASGQPLGTAYDPALVFGADAPLLLPQAFINRGLAGINKAIQHGENRLACAFAMADITLKPGESYALDSLIGFTPSTELLNQLMPRFLQNGYADKKREESARVVSSMLEDVNTATANQQFDAYIAQCYLDNLLRGGYPRLIGGKVVHLFSRKHGDPERDYNWFVTSGEPYSQGNGNFRDVCQNRRMDVSLHPEVGDFNVHNFYSLIQMDGYNPLEIRPSRFVLKAGLDAGGALKGLVEGDLQPLVNLLKDSFTLGQVVLALRQHGLKTPKGVEAVVEALLQNADQQLHAGFGEGCWSDHWTYLLDLVEDYLKVYPDKQDDLLCGRADYRFFHSGARVRPRTETCQLTDKGVRRYDALDAKNVVGHTRWLKDAQGQAVTTNLLGKMLVLAATKAASLDPEGLGISMDGGRPGWNDAMNGLPGLFGSGMAEALELRRHLRFLLNLKHGQTTVPEELAAFVAGLQKALKEEDAFKRWDSATTLLEGYRATTWEHTGGEAVTLSLEDIRPFLQTAMQRVEEGIRQAFAIGQGIMPTYFTYEATAYEPLMDATAPRLSASGLPLVRVTAFERRDVPHFLEGPARQLACAGLKAEEAKKTAEAVRNSDLFDPHLGMYLTSVPLNHMSMELGRIRAFTPGWLERESVFLHMAYKYLLGLLESGQQDAFWAAARTGLVPFMDADTYGRSTLENSSFIASSRNPDPAMWGRGFVARLSGSTAEMLSIWQKLFWGEGGMELVNGRPAFRFDPRLPHFLLDDEGRAAFTLFSTCQVVAHGNKGWSNSSVKSLVYRMGGKAYTVQGSVLPDGEALRQGDIDKVDIYLCEGEAD
ncbi:MAG: cellobiose phosphorylase [Clostridiales bacterium]|jgi:hypothetical protein|nr:cellobiose phosphorylase [Clostridiales bacterium]